MTSERYVQTLEAFEAILLKQESPTQREPGVCLHGDQPVETLSSMSTTSITMD